MIKKLLFIGIILFSSITSIILAVDTTVPTAVMCTMEAKMCSDGSYVSRIGPNCEFAECPIEKPVVCTMEVKMCSDGSYVGRIGSNCEFAECPIEKPAVCTMEYAPVCGQPPMPKCLEGVNCIEVMPSIKTYSNKCSLEAEEAEYLYDGECEGIIMVDEYPVIQDKYKKIVDNFLEKMFAMIDKKYNYLDDKIKFLEQVSERIIDLSKKKPRFEEILLYIDWYIQEALVVYYDDIDDLSELLDSLY